MSESWRKVWREGIAPLLSTQSLKVLEKALKTDDSRLLQGVTTEPPPVLCVHDWPVEGACPVGYCGWQGEGLETVLEVEEFFSALSYEIDARLGELAACGFFYSWWDSGERGEVVAELLREVRLELATRKEKAG